MSEGYWTLPTRVTLPTEQRERLERLCRQRNQDVSEIVSEIVLTYLEDVPESALADPLPEPYQPTLAEQLRHNERELRRLRMRQKQLGVSAPHWLESYIQDIQTEITSLKQRLETEV